MANLPVVGVQIEALGASTFDKNMNMVMRDIVNLSRVNTALARTGSSDWGDLGKAMSGAAIVAAAASVTITAAITSIITKSTEMAAKFEQATAEATIMAGGTSQDFHDISNTVLEMARDTTLSISQLTNITGELARSGISIQDTIGGAAEAVNNLVIASGGEIDVERATLAVAGAMNAFALKGEQANDVVDALGTAALRSAITFGDVQRSFQQAVGPAAILGYTVQDLAAAIGMMGLAGLRGSDAGTSLKQMLLSLVKPSAQAEEMMKRYNVSLFDSSGKALDFVQVVGQLEGAFGDAAVATGKLTELERAQALAVIFGSDGWRAAALMAKFGTKEFNNLTSAMKRLSMANMAQKMLQPTAAQFTILNNQIKSLTTTLGGPTSTAMGKFVRSVNVMLRQLDAGTVEAFGKALASILTGIGPSSQDLYKFADTPMAEVFNSWSKFCLTLNDALFNKLIPSFIVLFQTLTGGKPVTDIITSILNKLTTIITDGATYVKQFILAASYLIGVFKQWEIGATILKAVLMGIITLPFLGMVRIIYGMLKPFIALSSTAVAASIALYTIPKAISATLEILQGGGDAMSKFVAIIQNGFVLASVAAVLFATGLYKQILPALWAVTKVAATALWTLITTFFSFSKLAVSAIGSIPVAFSFLVKSISFSVARAGIFLASLSGSILTFSASVWRGIGSAVGAFTAFAVSVARNSVLIITSLARVAAIYTAMAAAAIAAFVRTAASAVVNAAIVAAAWAFDAALSMGVWIKYMTSSLYGFIDTMGVVARSVVKSLTGMGHFFWVAANAAQGATRFIVAAVGRWIAAQAMLIANSVRLFAIQKWLWIQGVAQSAIAGIGAAIGAILPILAVLALVGAAAYGLYEAWSTNFLGIRDFVKKVIDFIVSKLVAFFNFLKGLPIIGSAIEGVIGTIQAVADTISVGLPKAVETAKGALNDLKGTAIDTFNKVKAEAERQLPGVLDMLGLKMPDMGNLDDQFEKAQAEVAALTQEIGDLDLAFPELAGGANSAADATKKWQLAVAKLLSVLPIVTQEAIEFIAALAEANPERLGAMVVALRSSIPILNQMVAASKELLLTNIAIEQSEARIAMLEALIGVAQARYEQEILSLQQQELSIRIQIASIDARELPLKNRAAAIERQISLLQRDNYDLAVKRANLELSEMPYQRELVLIQRKIADIGDKRYDLALREKQLVAEGALADMQKDLRGTTAALEEAWASGNVAEIIRLEALKAQQEKEVTTRQDAVDNIRDEQDAIARRNELASIGLEYEKLAIEEVIKDMDRKLEDLEYENDLQRKRNEITILALEHEKQGIEDILYDMDLQKQALEDMIAALDLQMQIKELAFRQSIAQYEQELANEKLLRAQLELTRLQQAQALKEISLLFVALMVSSGAFTATEAIEIAKRLGLWDSSFDALGSLIGQYDQISNHANDADRIIAALNNQISNTGTAGGGGGGGGGVNGVAGAYKSVASNMSDAYNEVVRLNQYLPVPPSVTQSLDALIAKYGVVDSKTTSAVDEVKKYYDSLGIKIGGVSTATNTLLEDTLRGLPRTEKPITDIGDTYTNKLGHPIQLVYESTIDLVDYHTKIFPTVLPVIKSAGDTYTNKLEHPIQLTNTSTKTLVTDTVAKLPTMNPVINSVGSQYNGVTTAITTTNTATNTLKATTETDSTIMNQTLKTVQDSYSTLTGRVNGSRDSVDELRKAIDALHDKTITITIVTVGSIPSEQHGGTVPGRWGEPTLIMAHGGERFMGINSVSPASASVAGARATPVQNVTNNTSYNVSANYSRVQSAASVAMDMRAMVGMTKK